MPDVNQKTSAATERINAATVEVLREVIAAKRLKQTAIADDIGMSRVAVSRYLNGHREVPLALVFGVAKHSGIPASEIVQRIGRRVANPLT